MHESGVTRRVFLSAAGLAAVAAACGGDDTKTEAGAGAGATSTTLPGLQPLNAQVASQDLYVGGEQRLAVGIFRLKADETIELVQGEEVILELTPPNEPSRPPQAATFHADGLPPDRGVYVTHAVFDAAGVWDALVTVGDLKATVAFEVKAEPSAPKEGSALPSVKTPTTADPTDVDPICTRTPACPFHAVSLDQALGGDLPIVVMISTPAFCTSRVCGPVLDLMIDLSPEFDERATFIHIEVWKDNQAQEFSPGVTAFGIETEPWVFAAEAGGTVVARLDGAFDRTELRGLIESVTGASDAADEDGATSSTEGDDG